MSHKVIQMWVADVAGEVLEVCHSGPGHASDSYCNLMVQLAPTELSCDLVVLLICAPFAQ